MPTKATSCRPLCFGVKSFDVRRREAKIAFCRNARLFGADTSSRAVARPDRANAGGAPALPEDGISPRPPREFRIGRSDRARFLQPESAWDQDGPRRAQGRRFHRNPSAKATLIGAMLQE